VLSVVMQKFVAIVQAIAEIWRIFKTAAIRHPGFFKNQNFDNV